MRETSDGDPRVTVIYEEAVRGWALQSSVLDELRSRTGVLLAAASVAAALLGSADLTKHETFTFLGTLALIAFCVVVVLCVIVLWPTQGWTFTHDARLALEAYVEQDRTLDETRQNLAIRAEEYRDENDGKLTWKFRAFQGASLALGASVVLWLIDLN
jgi:hypothetical protein